MNLLTKTIEGRVIKETLICSKRNSKPSRIKRLQTIPTLEQVTKSANLGRDTRFRETIAEYQILDNNRKTCTIHSSKTKDRLYVGEDVKIKVGGIPTIPNLAIINFYRFSHTIINYEVIANPDPIRKYIDSSSKQPKTL